MPEDTTNNVLVLSENGYGKRSELDAYRVTNRGGKGVRTMNVTDKTGRVVAMKSVNDENDLVIINKSGITLRIRVADIRVMGRYAQGVRLINLEKRQDQIASVCCVDTDPEEETEEVQQPTELEPELTEEELIDEQDLDEEPDEAEEPEAEDEQN